MHAFTGCFSVSTCSGRRIVSAMKLEIRGDRLQKTWRGLEKLWLSHRKVQVGKDQEKAQSEKDSHSKNRGGKKNQTNNQVLIP